jgi:hypothetical protein
MYDRLKLTPYIDIKPELYRMWWRVVTKFHRQHRTRQQNPGDPRKLGHGKSQRKSSLGGISMAKNEQQKKYEQSRTISINKGT